MTETTAPVRRRIAWPPLVAALALGAGTIALIWLAAVPFGPLVCPAIYPAPRNCFAESRIGTGWVVSVIVAAATVLTVVAAMLSGERWRVVRILGVSLLVVAPAVSYLAVAWIPGFA